MDSSEVICLSSDEETPFECTQRILKEHHEQEDCRQVQYHLSRVSEEVKEGIRKFLRTGAFPEPSNITLAIPIDKTLAVSVVYEPGFLKFNIMSQQSKIGSQSPPLVVAVPEKPYVAFLY